MHFPLVASGSQSALYRRPLRRLQQWLRQMRRGNSRNLTRSVHGRPACNERASVLLIRLMRIFVRGAQLVLEREWR